MRVGRAVVGHPVDVASGAVYCTRRDACVGGGVALVWDRRYSTALLDSALSPLGPGWTARYFASLRRAAGALTILLPEGHTAVFEDPDGVLDRGGVLRNLVV